MLVTLDSMATRYHVLPSELMERASTFDLHCMDLGIRYQRYRQQVQEGTVVEDSKVPTSDELLKMMRRVNGADYGKR